MPSAKEMYQAWLPSQPDIPVFAHPWWLDAASGGEDWDVILVEENERIIASMPFVLKRRGPFRLISMPAFTQTLGPYLTYPAGISASERLSREKKIIGELIARLPRADFIRIRCSPRLTNWLPFYWAGYSQTTSYTYVLNGIADDDAVLKAFDYSKRKDVKKALNAVEVAFDLPPDVFYDHHKESLAKHGQKIFYTHETFRRVHDAARANNSGRTIFASDKKTGHVHAALFVIWSREGAYDLISTIDPEHRNSGAATLLVREIIRHIAQYTDRFDFEGSMIEGVEASFRKFGAEQTPYMVVTRTPSRLLRLRQAAIDVLRPAGTPPGSLFLFGPRLTKAKPADS